MTSDSNIALKIKKLLELAGRDEKEAASYMAKAQELMAKYNLDMAQVGSATDTKAGADYTHPEDIANMKRVKDTHKRGAMYEYQRNLWATVATANYCWHWTIPIYKDVNGTSRVVTRHHMIVGREVNVISAKLMGDYLEQTINRMCPYQGSQCLSRAAISWKEGCASKLQVRLRTRYSELKEESTKVSENSTALTLVGVENAEYDANYAFLYGEKALQDKRARDIARRTEQAEQIINAPAEKAETNAERKKREARYARNSAKWQRQSDAKWAKKDINAWYEGRSKGEEISLDSQVDKGKGERSIE